MLAQPCLRVHTFTRLTLIHTRAHPHEQVAHLNLNACNLTCATVEPLITALKVGNFTNTHGFSSGSSDSFDLPIKLHRLRHLELRNNRLRCAAARALSDALIPRRGGAGSAYFSISAAAAATAGAADRGSISATSAAAAALRGVVSAAGAAAAADDRGCVDASGKGAHARANECDGTGDSLGEVGSAGASADVEGDISSSTLQKLDLRGNLFRASGVRSLLMLLEGCPSLQALDIRSNDGSFELEGCT
jgi:hypothetical protein